MSFWSQIIGQETAIAELETALQAAAAGEPLAHAWLITGPPGSGRYNLALRFAAALVAEQNADPTALAVSRETQYAQVAKGTHPDVKLVRTQTNELTAQQMRDVVANAYFAPATAPRRVIVIEDADRMNAQAANATLKALEEPPETTVWLLCAPSESDLLPTIRSRTRMLRLVTPDPAATARLLTERDGVAPALAATAARLAQGHIGMAKRLAADPQALKRREDTISQVLNISNLAGAMAAASALYKLAEDDASGLVADNLEADRAALYRSLGLEPGASVPRDYSRQFKELEEDAKRRLSRAKIDGVDRILLDLLTLCRDIMVMKLHGDASGVEKIAGESAASAQNSEQTAEQLTAAGQQTELINQAQQTQITAVAANISLAKICEFAARLETARERLGRNIQPALVLEAALVGLITIPNE